MKYGWDTSSSLKKRQIEISAHRKIKGPVKDFTTAQHKALMEAEVRIVLQLPFLLALFGSEYDDSELSRLSGHLRDALAKWKSFGELLSIPYTDIVHTEGTGIRTLALLQDICCALGVTPADWSTLQLDPKGFAVDLAKQLGLQPPSDK